MSKDNIQSHDKSTDLSSDSMNIPSSDSQIIEKSLTYKFFKNIKSNPVNNKCADCSKSSPIWVSLTFSLFICSDCASSHRKMGVLKSQVKSTLLDKWTLGELRRVWVGGNKNKYKLGDNKDVFIKYKDSQFYKDEIDKMVEKSKEEDGDEFIKEEEESEMIKTSEVREEEIPKFADNIEDIKDIKDIKDKKDIKDIKDKKIKKSKEVFNIKKRSMPKISKNKTYEIEDESRLGFTRK
ncbi:ADP-ribosylation factor GTPase-activating protein GLO3 [Vairimorpha necatrix]|uniref:ADP-ribosylation factor GTPase-activating protein GLO3 n=1 Tax=Vairimorpha necatrix TaxID=6039 RepID=A0AAX4JFA1_9MICR